MKSRTWIGGAIFLLVIALPAFGQPDCNTAGKLYLACTKKGLKPCVPSRHSETNWWCWSATAQMIMEYWGKPISEINQCRQADDYYLRQDRPCCSGSSTPSGTCSDRGGWPRFGKYGFNSIPKDLGEEKDIQRSGGPARGGVMDWDQLTQQICQFGPFAYSYGDQPGELGHMVVATGYHTRKKGRLHEVQRIDSCYPVNGGCPGGGCCVDKTMVSYDDYLAPGDPADPNATVHWTDYKEIHP